jgi:pimeloyl-ACP methyl ester carboxylesterase
MTQRLRISANGITQSALVWAPVEAQIDGPAVLLVHGNCSSAAFWATLVRLLPTHWRVVAPDLRGYGETDPAPVDARRGLSDFSDDVAALLASGELFPAGARPVVVGHSMGGGVAMQLTVDHPDLVRALMLESPLSPYGFGGTRDLDGTPTTEDFAGTGGGAVNPEFVRRLAERDRSSDDAASPRNVMRATYVADPAAFGADEDALLDSMLSTVVGDDNYPGDSVPSPNWPMTSPGPRGVLNTMSPRYFNVAASLVGLAAKPPIVWVRGAADAIVSDTSLFDLAYLGQLGAVPGWPGEQACPPQPMVSQTRAVLDRYRAAGGTTTEIAYEGVGHSPHVERPDEFAAALVALVTNV